MKHILLLVFLSGTALAAIPPLNTNRVEVIQTYSENVYGVRPDLSGFHKTCVVTDRGFVTGLKAHRKDAVLNVATPHGERNFTAVGFFPERKSPVPCFVYISFEDPDLILAKKAHQPDRWPVDLILERGYATVAFFYRRVFPDNPRAFAPEEKRPPNGWGSISTWALAASRVCDWLETESSVDLKKIALVGHSRLGKTAIWAGATDTRFAYIVSNDSGCMGALPASCTLEGGETVADLMKAQWAVHWFAPNCRKLSGRAKEMPFDQHWLLACIAPRLLAVGSAEDDLWACPSGEHMGLELARPAWGPHKDRCHYHIRPGEHDINRIDWTDYLNFATKHGW